MFVDYAKREANFKVVYYGPGLSGKTTSLEWLHQRHRSGAGKMVCLATDTERTLFFDFRPAKTPVLAGFDCRFHLYTVPGPVFYDESRRLVLRGVDAVVFVCDSQEARMDANEASLMGLEMLLEVNGRDLAELPHVFQYNKRDLPEIVPVETLREQLNAYDAPDFEAVAIRGEGVYESLRAVIERMLQRERATRGAKR